jgi:aconitase A
MAQVSWISSEHFLHVFTDIILTLSYSLSWAENCLIGAITAENGMANKVLNQFAGSSCSTDYCGKGIKWVIIGDSNYPKGSPHEHAALKPCYLGDLAIII